MTPVLVVPSFNLQRKIFFVFHALHLTKHFEDFHVKTFRRPPDVPHRHPEADCRYRNVSSRFVGATATKDHTDRLDYWGVR